MFKQLFNFFKWVIQTKALGGEKSESSDFIAVFFFYMGFHFILFYFEWKQIIQEPQCFDVGKYSCKQPKKKKKSGIY